MITDREDERLHRDARRVVSGVARRRLGRDGAPPRLAIVERLAEAEAERDRLLVELESARCRTAAAEAAAAASIEAQTRVASLVLAAHRELVEARERDGAVGHDRLPPPVTLAAIQRDIESGNGAGHGPVAVRPSSVTSIPRPVRRAAPRRRMRRFLHVDTVLPMLGVLIVLVVLLAWII